MMKLSSVKNSPAFAAQQRNFAQFNCCGIPSCRSQKHTCCSQNEPSGSGRTVEDEHMNQARQLDGKNTAALLMSAFLWSTTTFPAAAATATELAASTSVPYTPSPMEPGFEIYVGFVAGVVPFIIASYEFGKRILIQRRCPECRGVGLVQRGKVLRKCTQCGGMLPWLGWKMFLFSTLRPGNGGPLNQPKGQKSVFYSVPPPLQPPTQETSENNTEKASISSENES